MLATAPRHPVRALVASALVAAGLLTAACSDSGDDDGSAAEASSTTASTVSPSEVLASCTPAQGTDFVAVERHLSNGAQHLGAGFVADQPDGRYLIADVFSVDNAPLGTGLVWRIDGVGAASSATPETSAFDTLPDVPEAEAAVPEGLYACSQAYHAPPAG